MHNLTVQILDNNTDEIIAKSNYVHINQKDKNLCTLKLSGVTFISGHGLKKGTDVYVKILIGPKLLTGLEIQPLDDVFQGSDADITMLFAGNLENFLYDQQLIDVLSGWDRGEFSDWRPLDNGMKRAWLVACFYTSFPQNHVPHKNIVLECSTLKTVEDFYCALGEAFYGRKGYIGSNLDALEDCLTQLPLERDGRPEILLKNFSVAEKILATQQPNYAAVLISIFENHGFKIQIE